MARRERRVPQGAERPGSHLARILRFGPVDASLCARFIDLYGDSTINQPPFPTLIAELKALRPAIRDSTAGAHLEAVIALACKAVGSVHTYLEFIGD